MLFAVLSGYLTGNVTRMGEVGRDDSPAMPVHTDNKTVALAKDFTLEPVCRCLQRQELQHAKCNKRVGFGVKMCKQDLNLSFRKNNMSYRYVDLEQYRRTF